MRLNRLMQRKPSPSAWRTGLKSITSAYPPQSPSSGYARGRLDSMRRNYCLSDQTRVVIERPVNKQAAPDEVFFRHRSPITDVVAIVAVIAQRKITMPWHRKGTIWRSKIIMPLSIAAIGKLRRHHPGETKTLSFFSINV